MSDAVMVALITGVCAGVPSTITALASYRRAKKNAKKQDESSHKQDEILKRVDGHVTVLMQSKDVESDERAKRVWKEAFEAGRMAEIQRTRRVDDQGPHPNPSMVVVPAQIVEPDIPVLAPAELVDTDSKETEIRKYKPENFIEEKDEPKE